MSLEVREMNRLIKLLNNKVAIWEKFESVLKKETVKSKSPIKKFYKRESFEINRGIRGLKGAIKHYEKILSKLQD